MKNIIPQLGGAVAAVLMAANAHASVTMALSDSGIAPGGGYFAAEDSGAFTAKLTGYVNPNTGNSQIIGANELIGIYQFTVSPGGSPTLNSPFYATCISPAGVLPDGSLTYNQENFATAQAGQNPPSWAGANNVNGGYGIQNANYLYNQLAPTIINGALLEGGDNATYNAQGAAMALAMYTVLYNSTGYGTYNSALSSSSGGSFQITGGLGPRVMATVYNDYIGDLKLVAKMNSSLDVEGGVLVPQISTAQELLLIGGYQQGSPVPEPATIIAGALLLLPFGASTVRILRKSGAV